MSNSRDLSSVTLTVHTVRFSHDIDGAFVFSWKCSSSGLTERQIPSSGVVTFDKVFIFTVPFHFDRHQKLKAKLIKCCLSRVSQSGSLKKYGEAELNLVDYAMANNALSSDKIMISPHKPPPVISLTILVIPANSVTSTTSMDLSDTLTSSAISDLTSDHENDWDISGGCDAESFAQFSSLRHKEHTNLVTVLSLKTRPLAKSGPGRKVSKEGGDMLSRFYQGDVTSTRRPSIKTNLQKIASFVSTFSWSRGTVCQITCPPAAAIYATFSVTPWLREGVIESHFNLACDLFWDSFERKQFVANAHPFDILYVALYLLKLLKQPLESAEPKRLNLVIEHVVAFAVREFDREVDARSLRFKEIAKEVIKPDFNPDSIVFECSQAFRILDIPAWSGTLIHRLITKRILEIFDATLVEELLDHPDFISVIFTAQLGPFISNLKFGDFGQVLVLLSETIKVVMLSQSICEARGEIGELLNDVCPHLSKQIVLKILKNQTIDDFHPFPNDTGSFEAFLATELRGNEQLLKSSEIWIEEAAETIDVSHWKEAVLPPQAFRELDFLKSVFTEPQLSSFLQMDKQ
jgi:hypothetical protein